MARGHPLTDYWRSRLRCQRTLLPSWDGGLISGREYSILRTVIQGHLATSRSVPGAAADDPVTQGPATHSPTTG